MFDWIKENFNSFQEKSILSIDKFVLWKKTKNLYNINAFPDTAIITLTKFALPRRFLYKKIHGLKTNTYLINKNLIFFSNFGEGGPSILSLLEELYALKIRKIIFIGIAGIIDNTIEENQAFIIRKTISGVGASYYYSNQIENNILDTDFSKQVKKILNLSLKNSCSTDCPFKETSILINQFKTLDASLIDMESAAIYAFSKNKNMDSVCILISADSLVNNQWSYPTNMQSIQEHTRDIVQKIIKNYGRM